MGREITFIHVINTLSCGCDYLGILNGRDILTSKYITAEITDSKDRIHYVPIKKSFDEYFIVELDGDLYAFTLKGARILTHYQTLTRSFRVIQFDTSHYSSLKPETKELELMLKRNALPKMDKTSYKIMSIFGKREKDDFESHNISDLISALSKKSAEFPTDVRMMQEYLHDLNTDKIVTPVRKITEFIHNDLIATSPSYLGGLLRQYHRANSEIRSMTNSPVKPTTNFMKIGIIAMMGVLIVAGLYFASEEGMFDGIFKFTDSMSTIGDGLSGIPAPGQFQTPNMGGADFSDAALQAKYTSEELKVAVNNGEVDYNKLSQNMKDMLDNVELEE